MPCAGRPKELRLSYAAARGRGMGRSGSRPGPSARGRGAGGRGRGGKTAAVGACQRQPVATDGCQLLLHGTVRQQAGRDLTAAQLVPRSRWRWQPAQ